MSHYRVNSSRNAERLARFRQQMADFARGDRFRQLREAQHLSQEDAAHEIGVSVKALRSWEHGGGIKWRNATAAGTFYDVDPDSLVRHESVTEPLASEDVAQIHRKLDELLDRQAGLAAALAQVRDAQERLLQPPARAGRSPGGRGS